MKAEVTLPDDVAVRLTDVWKRYRTGAIRGKTLVREAQSFIARMRGDEDPNKLAMDRSQLGASNAEENDWFWAVKGASFEVKKGECVVILGRNGAGKSTLLQVLCGITEADRGLVQYKGRFATLLQAGVGFHPELTGRENIFLNGSILGLSREEIIHRIPTIAEFSEIPEFLDTPVKRYSSGMTGRLGFSVAAHLGAETMILDEVFATGDRVYREKCIDRIKELASSGTTILLVTHLVDMLEDAVSRAIFMQDGEIRYDGDTDQALRYYLGQDALPGEQNKNGKVVIDDEETQLQELARSSATRKIRENPTQSQHYFELGNLWLEVKEAEYAYCCFRNALALTKADDQEMESRRRQVEEIEETLTPLEKLPPVAKRNQRIVEGIRNEFPEEHLQILHVTNARTALSSRYFANDQVVIADKEVCGLDPKNLPFMPRAFDVVFCRDNIANCKTWRDWEKWITYLMGYASKGVALLAPIGFENPGVRLNIELFTAGCPDWIPARHVGSDQEIDLFAEKRGFKVSRVAVGGEPIETYSAVAQQLAPQGSLDEVNEILNSLDAKCPTLKEAVQLVIFSHQVAAKQQLEDSHNGNQD